MKYSLFIPSARILVLIQYSLNYKKVVILHTGLNILKYIVFNHEWIKVFVTIIPSGGKPYATDLTL